MGEELISRPYQAALEEIASKKNTIIHLPTGSGKTFIAICLIRRFGAELQKPWGKGGKRTFFLVNTVPLVTQQKRVLETSCPVRGVGAYSGENGVDYWDKDKWDEELTKNEVVVMTSQILSDMLTHVYIKLKDINLIIFDECHHAVDDHPMRLIMKHFENCPVEHQPRVLGLTATLLNGNVSITEIERTLKDLENTFHATIATVNELGEVLTYSTNPNEILQDYSEHTLTSDDRLAIQTLVKLEDLIMAVEIPRTSNHELKLKKCQWDISSDPKKIVKAVKNMVVSMIGFIEEMGAFGGSIGILAYVILLERLKRKASTKEEESLYIFTITHCLEAHMILLQSMKGTGYQRIINNSSLKIKKMLNVLKEYNPALYENPNESLHINLSRKPLSAIIFTKQRFTAKVVYNILKEVIKENPTEFGFLKPDFIVGFNVNPMKCTREQTYLKKAAHKALLEFKQSELNCLISTSVIEEGVDIPQCLLVLRYDPPMEYRSYIQSKGRARNKDSSYVILVKSSEKAKFMKSYEGFQRVEKFIQGVLVGNTEDRKAPSAGDIQQQLYEADNIPPYITKNGARLSSVSAVSLLNRYFSMLPHDQFTTVAAAWIQENIFVKETKHKLISIILPLASPVKDIIKGIPQPTTKEAKRSTALEACKKLHQIGELDEITLLPKRYARVDFDESDVVACFPNWPTKLSDEDPENMSKPGSKKTVRKHRIFFPSCLQAQHENTYYLHIIKLQAAFPEPKNSREKSLYDFIQSEQGYGIITEQPLAKLCPFATYMKVGEVNTDIQMNYAVTKLNEDLFDLVKRFHYFVFDQVLGVAKKFLTFEGEENCMYVVPIKAQNGYDIDWEIMKDCDIIRPIEVPDVTERKSIRVTREEYLHKVVTPWYRGTLLPDRYIVSNILEYMSPQSYLGGNSEQTFVDYFSNKYNLDLIGDKNQCLLEVQNITTGMNCLLPRAATIRTFTDKQRKQATAIQGDDQPGGFEEIFVAEFCLKYEYPGVLWYKATMLPSIIHSFLMHRNDEPGGFEEIFVAEFCLKYEYPGVLWYKVNMIASIKNRITQMLVAQELMIEIHAFSKYGTPVLSKNENWLPIKDDREVVAMSLLSQIEKPTPAMSIDRMNPSTFDNPENLPKIKSMKKDLYQLQKKKINKDYPWDEQMEPIDIERNINSITIMDIECYDEFVSAPLNNSEVVKSPPRVVLSPTKNAALKPPPLKYIDKINILDKQPVGRGPEIRDVVSALTTIKSHDSFCLERAETLGDSFLKFAATLYLYHKFPNKNEGQLTNIKCKLISNRNLYYAGERVNLGGRMKVEPFAPRKDFMLPGFFVPKPVKDFIEAKKIRPTFVIGTCFSEYEALSGELFPESIDALHQKFSEGNIAIEPEPEGEVNNAMQCYFHSKAVSDKSVADCVEAVIGTYLLTGGILAAVKVLEWFRILPEADNFASLLKRAVPTIISQRKAELKDIHYLLDGFHSRIEEIINYKFKDPSFLLEALTHSSYIRNRLTRSYERLEFLGDAILDFLITSHIFENSPELKPGELTDLRSALVNNVTFASYVVKLGLHKFICKEFNPLLDKAIMEFVEHQTQREHEIVEDVLYLIDEEDCQVSEYVEVPKVLSDIFESLTGAIYLDSGGDLKKVWSVIYPIMCNELDAFSARIPQQPVKVLHESIHACPKFLPAMNAETDIPKVFVPVKFTKDGKLLTVFGVGHNKSQAKRAAAKLALKLLAS